MANPALLIPSFNSNVITQETKALESQALQFTQPRPLEQSQTQTEKLFRSGLQPVAYLNLGIRSFSTLPPLPQKPNYLFVNPTGKTPMGGQDGQQKNQR
ncbi:MAG: hypothetical protein LW809_03390 [Vampirovibrionales bacterium]|jgi:hypothetical protein|nr:hypothetical protein [Vampirovibrionales bacterium]